MSFSIDGTGGNENLDYFVNQDLTAFNMEFIFEDGTEMEDAIFKGIDIALDDLTLLSGATAYGLYIDMTSDNSDSEAALYAAVFSGGTVGIGTTTPDTDYALDVDGSVLVDSVTITDKLFLIILQQYFDVNESTELALLQLMCLSY